MIGRRIGIYKLQSKSKVKTRLLLVLLLLLSGIVSGCGVTKEMPNPEETGDQPATADFFAMDTYMTITAYGAEAQAAVAAGKQAVYEMEALFSRNQTDSDLSKINSQSGKEPVAVSQETFELITKALSYAKETQSAFDPTIAPVIDIWGFNNGDYHVPSDKEISTALDLVGWKNVIVDATTQTVFLPVTGMELDLGGIAKGFASDQVQKTMNKYDITAGLLSLGGNVAVFGTKPDDSLWNIAIANPNKPSTYLGVVKTAGISVITSGGYERFFEKDGQTYIHIIDPATGAPVKSDLLSVSIVSPDGVCGDALSTALFVMGKDQAIEFWREHKNFACILVDQDKRVWASDDLRQSFSLTGEGSGFTLSFFK